MAMVTVEQARKILGDANMTDEQIEELLATLYSLCDSLLDDYFKKKHQSDVVKPVKQSHA